VRPCVAVWAELNRILPPDAIKLALTLFLSFLIGLEREQHKQRGPFYSLGGIRTLPLIALSGYGLALLSGDQLLLIGVGFAVVGGFMLVSYRYRLGEGSAGITTEVSALITYLVGALMQRDHVWIASALAIISVLLLELKVALEALTTRISPDEAFSFAQFLLLTIVILPVLPNRDFGAFHLNPFKTWVVVVAVSGVSYGSYLLQKVTRGRGGVLLSAILGGAYSSTVTTVVLAKQSKTESRPHRYAGSIVTACGMMYLRLAVLLALFNRQLFAVLALPFVCLAGVAVLFGSLWSLRKDAGVPTAREGSTARNPLELRAALLFAALFVAMVVATQLASTHLGRGGIFTLASLMGLADVDPFILGVAQTAGTSTSLQIGAQGVLIAAASNNLAKGIYAYAFGERHTGRAALLFLLVFAALGLVPLFFR
jgi:uncharacterized membrane protein (DUF4010 family)